MSGTSAEQFALLGAVFLILGGTFVFAPQIISAVNGFLAAVFRRPKKTPAQTPTPATTAEALPHPPSPVRAHEDGSEWAAPTAADHAWQPPPPEQPGGAVARLREEISSSWGREEPR
jgi:hypothetical protein